MSIPIKNIFHMLAYVFKSMTRFSRKNIETEDFNHIDDLFAEILVKGFDNQMAKGLNRGYEICEEELAMPRGRIQFEKTVQKQGQNFTKALCVYDSLTENTDFNRIIKTTIMNLNKNENVNQKRKKRLRVILDYLENVDGINLNNVRWDEFQFTQITKSYDFLIFICKMLHKRRLISRNEGSETFYEYFEENEKREKSLQNMIFQQFVVALIKEEHPELKSVNRNIFWKYEGNGQNLPKMQADHIYTSNELSRTMIIDTKWYQKTMKGKKADKRTYENKDIYQIFTYLNNFKTDGKELCGVLVYAKTNEITTPNELSLKICGMNIKFMAVDLSSDFEKIKHDVNAVINSWFTKR